MDVLNQIRPIAGIKDVTAPISLAPNRTDVIGLIVYGFGCLLCEPFERAFDVKAAIGNEWVHVR